MMTDSGVLAGQGGAADGAVPPVQPVVRATLQASDDPHRRRVAIRVSGG